MANTTSTSHNIAIVGSGIGGLAFAYYFLKKHPDAKITMFEREKNVGGLAVPFEIQGTKLEKFYHHIFTTDTQIINLIKDLGLNGQLKWYHDVRATYYDKKLYPFTTPLDLLRFKPIPFIDRLRLAAVSFYLTKTKNWKNLEKYTADAWMRKYAGEKAYNIFWKPLLYGKFQERYKDITMSWLWSRIDTRVNSKGILGYMDGSFGKVFEALEHAITKSNGEIRTGVSISTIEKKNDKVEITYKDEEGDHSKMYDKVILTTPASIYTKLVKGFENEYITRVNDMQYISAQTIILTLSKKITDYYWVSVADLTQPALVFVEQSNLIDEYNGKHVVYIGNYLQNNSEILTMSQEELKELYYPFLKTLNPNFDANWVTEFRVFRAPFAQPIVNTDYHKHIPEFVSPIDNIYVLNMSQVYPEDRGMNFAIKNALKLNKILS